MEKGGNNNKRGISREELDKYEMILGEDGQYEDLLTWDEGYPIKLYQTKGYLNYKGNYLTIIYEGVVDNLNINLDRRSRDTNTGRYVYLTKYNQWFEITLKVGDINHENTDLVECGSEHLEEFISYVIEDNIQRVYDAYVNGESSYYRTYLLDQLRVKGITMRMFAIRESMGKTTKEMSEYLTETALKASLEMYDKYEEELRLGLKDKNKAEVNLDNIHVYILKNMDNKV